MAASDKPSIDALYVRPVVEEFKAFVQHKIEVLERFKNVDEIKVYLDAMELGVRTILEIQLEDADDATTPVVEFDGPSPEHPDAEPKAPCPEADLLDQAIHPEAGEADGSLETETPEESPGVETEELDEPSEDATPEEETSETSELAEHQADDDSEDSDIDEPSADVPGTAPADSPDNGEAEGFDLPGEPEVLVGEDRGEADPPTGETPSAAAQDQAPRAVHPEESAEAGEEDARGETPERASLVQAWNDVDPHDEDDADDSPSSDEPEGDTRALP